MPDLRQIVMVIAVDTQRQYPAPICPHCGKPMAPREGAMLKEIAAKKW
jgi:hypothetical protein